MPKAGRTTAGLLAVIAGTGLLQACGSGPSAPVGPTPVAAPRAAPSLCGQDVPRPVGDYDGRPGCRPGETVEIAQVIDAATFALADGRHVRLGGVAVRGAVSCEGRQAFAHTLGHVRARQQVNMVVEPGTDPSGALWVHLQFDPPGYADDLGATLAEAGLAEASQVGTNPGYTRQIQSLVDTARSFHIGQYGPPCAGSHQ